MAKGSSQQSDRCKSNMAKEALIDYSVSTHGSISMAYRNQLSGCLWTRFSVGGRKHGLFKTYQSIDIKNKLNVKDEKYSFKAIVVVIFIDVLQVLSPQIHESKWIIDRRINMRCAICFTAIIQSIKSNCACGVSSCMLSVWGHDV